MAGVAVKSCSTFVQLWRGCHLLCPLLRLTQWLYCMHIEPGGGWDLLLPNFALFQPRYLDLRLLNCHECCLMVVYLWSFSDKNILSSLVNGSRGEGEWWSYSFCLRKEKISICNLDYHSGNSHDLILSLCRLLLVRILNSFLEEGVNRDVELNGN